MRKLFIPYLVIFLVLALVYSCKKDDAKGPDPVLNISRTEIEVGNDVGYTDTVVIQSNIDLAINVSDEAKAWLSVESVKNAAGDSTVVTIKVIAANTSSSQTATLTITPSGSNSQPRQINVTRKAYKLVWQKCYGGSNRDEGYVTALLPNGQFVTTGNSLSTDGDAAGNTGDFRGWAFRSDSNGKLLWQKQIGGVNGTSGSVVASPDGGIVSAGYYVTTNRYADFSIVKLDANGNVVWSKTYGGSSSDIAYKIINTPDGGYLVSGITSSKDGDVTTNQGDYNIWVVKLDANGNLVWNKTFDKVEILFPTGLAACSDGGYVVCGTAGDASTDPRRDDFFVTKMDANGNKVWSKRYGGSLDETATSIIGDTDGGCIVTGGTNSYDGDVIGRHNGNYADMWTIKINRDGQIIWQVTAGGSKGEIGRSMVRLPNGNIAIGGYTDSNDGGITGNHGLADVWLVILNNTGKILWQKTFGSSGNDYCIDINAAADGSLLLTNNVNGGNDGDVSGNHGGFYDTWIFKLQ